MEKNVIVSVAWNDSHVTFFLSVSPFALSNVADLEAVHLVIDTAVLALSGSTLLAFRQAASDKTVFISVDDLKKYLQSLNKEAVEIDFKVLAAEKPAAAAAPSKPVSSKAKEGESSCIMWKSYYSSRRFEYLNLVSKTIAALVEDAHQMGIEYKKDIDFPKWYQQVKITLVHRKDSNFILNGAVCISRFFSRVKCWTTTTFLDATFCVLWLTTSGSKLQVSNNYTSLFIARGC